MNMNWNHLDNTELKDEITLIRLVIQQTDENPKLTIQQKEIIINQCLDKLKSLYDEQRKRGIIK